MGFETNINSFITCLDIFGQGIQLKINKQTKSQTFLGGLLSIIMIVLLIVFFYFSAQDVLYKTNPQISIEQQINEISSDLILDKYSFPISFSLTNYLNYRIFNPKFFTYSIVYTQGVNSSDLDEIDLNLTNCRIDHFPNIAEDKFYSQQLDKNLCIENQNISLHGSWFWQGESKNTKTLSLSVSICTDNEDCAPYEEIIDYLNSNDLFWNMYYQNTLINPQNADMPISYNIVNFFKSLKSETKKYSGIHLRKQLLQSEEGFLLQSTYLNESIAYDYELTDHSSFSNTLVEFEIFVSPSTFIYHRSYMKIQSAIANVGGLANVFKECFLIICYIFSIIKRDEIILNKIFDFEFHPKTKNLMKKKINLKFENSLYGENKMSKSLSSIKSDYSKSIPKIDCVGNIGIGIGLHQNINSFSIENSLRNDKIIPKTKNAEKFTTDEISYKVKKTMEKLNRRIKNYELSFSFIENIYAFILCNCFRSNKLKTKKKMYDLSEFAIDQFLDISYIIQKLEEFEKFKLVMLDSQQIALFDFISKELISLDDERIKSHDLTKMKNLNKNKEKLAQIIIKYQKKLKDKFTEVSPTDRKLIELLNEDLK